MNGVLLDSTGRPARSQLEIIVPAHLAEEQQIKLSCNVCGATFGDGEGAKWQKHVGRCAIEHIDELRAQAPSERNKGTFFDINERDRELEAHFRRVGERMRREGRWDVKPNERAEVG